MPELPAVDTIITDMELRVHLITRILLQADLMVRCSDFLRQRNYNYVFSEESPHLTRQIGFHDERGL